MSVSPRQRSARKTRTRVTVALMVSRESGLYASPQGFWRLCRDNSDLRLERTAKGEVIAMAPAGSDSGWRNGKLTMRLGNWTEADGKGECFDSSTGFTLPNGSVRSPDASWMPKERWEALPPRERIRFAHLCPDFVIELTSPSDKFTDVQTKMVEYIKNGVRLGWLLHREKEIAEVYRPGRPVETLMRPDSLSGEDVLPGFVLDLKGILFD
jgi:Uma2 family endonuclease